MLRPTKHRPQSTRLRILRSAVAGSVPIASVHPLQVERTSHNPCESLFAGQIGRKLSQILQIRIRNLVFDLVPVLRPFFQLIRLVPDHLIVCIPAGASEGSATVLDTISSGGSSTFTLRNAKVSSKDRGPRDRISRPKYQRIGLVTVPPYIYLVKRFFVVTHLKL